MTEGNDSSEAEATETEATTEEEAEEVVDGEESTQPNQEKADLEQIVEEPETLTEEQKAELNILMAKSSIEVEDLPNWLRAIIYTGKNIFNFISKKSYVDKKVNEYLNQNLKGKEIYVALHGIYQTYWSSFSDLVKYGEEKGIIVIPIKSTSPDDIYEQISDLKEKTGANIHIIGHSRGGRYALDAVIDHGLDKLVQEIILSGTPTHNLDGTFVRNEYKEVGKKVRLTNIYGLNDWVLPLFGRTNYGDLPNADNIPANAGHLDLIHNKDIFEIYTKHNFYAAPYLKLTSTLSPSLTTNFSPPLKIKNQ